MPQRRIFGMLDINSVDSIADVPGLQEALDGKAPAGSTGSADPTLQGLTALPATAGLVEQTAEDVFAIRAIGVGATTSIPTRANADARYAAISHQHAASDINSGTIATARLGSGTADNTTFLRGDNTWQPIVGGSGTPGGSTTQLQYNNAGAFAGSANLTFASNILGLNGTLKLSSFAALSAPADGQLTITDNAGTAFDRINLGGTTASFPSLKRSATALHIRLANDSAFAPVQMAGLTATTANLSGLFTLNAPGIAGNGEVLALTNSLGTASVRVGAGDRLVIGGDFAAVGSISMIASAPHLKFGISSDAGILYSSAGNLLVTDGSTGRGSITAAAATFAPAAALTGSSPPSLTVTQTWNHGATAFTGALVNITDTLSAAGSKIVDFQLGGVSRLNVNKTGLTAINGPAIAGNGEVLTLTNSFGTASLRVGTGNQFIVGGDIAAVGNASLISATAHLKFGTGSDAGILYTAAGNLRITDGSSGYGIITAKNITTPPFTITDGASVDIDPANGRIQTWNLGANRTATATNFAAGQSVKLLVDDGTAFTITWPTMTWINGTAPALKTTGYTEIDLFKIGTTLYGSYDATAAGASYSSAVNTFLAAADQAAMRTALGFSEGDSGTFGLSWLGQETAADAFGLAAVTALSVSFASITAGAFIASSSQLITESGISRTLATSDNGKTIVCTSSSSVTITLSSAQSLPVGFSCSVIRAGTGSVTFSASSTTINSIGGLVAISAQHGAASVLSTATNVFNLSGALA